MKTRRFLRLSIILLLPTQITFSIEPITYDDIQLCATRMSHRKLDLLTSAGVPSVSEPIHPLSIRATAGNFLAHVLKNFKPRPNSRVLDIGYGHPALPIHLSGETGAHVTGIDVRDLVPDWQKYLDRKVSLRKVPRNTSSRLDPLTRDGGPYELIYGVDIFKDPKSYRWGEAFEVEDRGAYARDLFDSLEPGGHFAIMNDFDEPTIFTRDELEKVGFEVIQWDERTEILGINASDMRLYRKELGEEFGKMRTYLLRKPAQPPTSSSR